MTDVVREHFRERIRDYLLRKPEAFPVSFEGPGNLLEVGCGARFSFHVEGLEKYGLDITPTMIRSFQKRNPEAHAIIGDVMSLPCKEGTFRVIVSNVLLHHLVGKSPEICQTNIKIALKEMKRALEPEGFVIIKELITRNYVFSLLLFYVTLLCAKVGVELTYFDIRAKVVTFFADEKTFVKIASEVGFKVHKLRSEEWNEKRFKVGAITQFFLSSKTNVISPTQLVWTPKRQLILGKEGAGSQLTRMFSVR